MSRTINAEGVRRSDLPLIPPDQIIVKHEENTRLYNPDVSDLVEDFESSVGQLEACVVRPIPGGFVQLVAGYRRWLAAMAVVKRQAKAGVPYVDRFKLACVVKKDIGPDDALIVNIKENANRKSLSPIENAVAIQRLRNTRSWHDAEGTEKIAKLFGHDSEWVKQTEELLALSEDQRLLVHQHFVSNGREGISKIVARILAKVPEERRTQALQEAEQSSMKGKENVPARVKAADMAAAASRNGAAVSGKPRPAKELYEFLDGYAETQTIHPLHTLTQNLIQTIRNYMARGVDEHDFDVCIMQIDGLAHAHWEAYQQTKKAAARARR